MPVQDEEPVDQRQPVGQGTKGRLLVIVARGPVAHPRRVRLDLRRGLDGGHGGDCNRSHHELGHLLPEIVIILERESLILVPPD